MSSPQRPAHTATLGGILACFIWGGSISVMGILAIRLGSLKACGYECLIAGLVLFAVSLSKGTVRQMLTHGWRYYLVCGGFWISNFALAWVAVGLVTQGEQLVIVGMFNYLWPILTLLCSIPVLGYVPGVLIIPGVMVTIVGLLLSKAVLIDMPLVEASAKILSLFDDNLPAYLCAALDAVAWALYSNLSRRMAKPNRAGAVPLFMLAAAVLLLTAGEIQGETSYWSLFVVLLLTGWSLLSAIAYVAWDYGMRQGSVVLISAFSMLIPLLSTVITCLVNGVTITSGLLAASACLVAGAWLCRKGIRERLSV